MTDAKRPTEKAWLQSGLNDENWQAVIVPLNVGVGYYNNRWFTRGRKAFITTATKYFCHIL